MFGYVPEILSLSDCCLYRYHQVVVGPWCGGSAIVCTSVVVFLVASGIKSPP